MAKIYPFGQTTLERLQAVPVPGTTHLWLPQVAGGLKRFFTPAQSIKFLRRCCDELVTHRSIPDREIAAAVELVYGGDGCPLNFGRKALDWPKSAPDAIARVLAEVPPAFEDSGTDGPLASDILPQLFRPGELVCTGRNEDHPLIRPLEESLADAHWQQFIVINPMRGQRALNLQGQPSVRCQNNVKGRRFLVAEFDDERIPKRQQARLVARLAQFAPLVMTVDSGGKSLHAWFRVEHWPARDQARFFAAACALGADPSRWDISGWLRMPGGLRIEEGVPQIRQRILYFNPQTTKGINHVH